MHSSRYTRSFKKDMALCATMTSQSAHPYLSFLIIHHSFSSLVNRPPSARVWLLLTPTRSSMSCHAPMQVTASHSLSTLYFTHPFSPSLSFAVTPDSYLTCITHSHTFLHPPLIHPLFPSSPLRCSCLHLTRSTHSDTLTYPFIPSPRIFLASVFFPSRIAFHC